MPRGRPFEKGNTLAPGGPRPNSGRPADWLKAQCRKVIEEKQLIKFLADVAAGESMEQAVGGEGEIISVPAAVRDRLKATEILLDRGFGKADQAIDVTTHGNEDRPTTEALLQTITALRAELDGARKGIGVEAGK